MRSGPFRTQNAGKHLGFQTHDAAVHGFGVLCVVVRRCAMWKNSCFITLSIAESIFHHKEPNTEDVDDGFVCIRRS